MKRLCIYLIYDRQNIVDGYIGYMLQELKTCSNTLAVVCNMPSVISGEEIIREYADQIFYRENMGFDAGGYKDALSDFIGWDAVWQYDELVLANDSFFGPFRSMKGIFKEMDERKADFWGLSKHGEKRGDAVHNFSEYIQSFFMVVRTVMLHDVEFKKYWDRMPYYTDFWDVVTQHEEKFTLYFKNLGYSYDVLANTEINDSKMNLANNYFQYAMISYELIKKRNFPFLKKQQISYNTLSSQTQENLRQAIDYIDKETDYDVNLIWDNIIRTLNVADLQRSLHLQYIVSDEKKESVYKNIAIVVLAEYLETAEYIIEYLKNVSCGSNYFIQIVSKRQDILEAYKSDNAYGRNVVDEQLFNLSSLRDFDYVCMLHDADVMSEIKPSCTGKSYLYCLWENLFKDSNHISGIVRAFEKEPRLGVLFPPPPNYAFFFGDFGKGWNGQYKHIKNIVEMTQINCIISEDKPPIYIGNNFWVRGSILKKLDGISEEVNSCLPYLWSYLAQDMGFYSGIVESTGYASMNEVNKQYYLNDIVGMVKKWYGNFSDFAEMKEKLLAGALKIYSSGHSRMLIYGAGELAQKYLYLLQEAEACLVSDGQAKPDFIGKIPVMYLSEARSLDRCGIVLCLNKKHQKQVIPVLETYGVHDFFCIPD